MEFADSNNEFDGKFSVFFNQLHKLLFKNILNSKKDEFWITQTPLLWIEHTEVILLVFSSLF